MLNYSLWSGHWEGHFEAARLALPFLEKAPGGLSHAIREVAYADFQASIKNSMQISLIASSFAARNAYVREAAGKVYADIHRRWRIVYAHTLNAHGLELRPGMSVDELTVVFTALADGLATRMLSDPTARVVDHVTRWTLLGESILALTNGAVVEVGSGDDRSVGRMVDGMVRK